MYCGNCGSVVEEGAIACTSCGFPPRIKKSFCYGCGVDVQLEQVLCVKCGFLLEEVREEGSQQKEHQNSSEKLARQARENIPKSEWIAFAILAFFALMVASETLIGGLICGAVIWAGYSHSFEKEKKRLLEKMPKGESGQDK